MDDEARRIAEGLTEAQQNLLWMWPKGLFDEQTRKALAKRGLINGRDVTPLGKAVRAILKEQTP